MPQYYILRVEQVLAGLNNTGNISEKPKYFSLFISTLKPS